MMTRRQYIIYRPAVFNDQSKSEVRYAVTKNTLIILNNNAQDWDTLYPSWFVFDPTRRYYAWPDFGTALCSVMNDLRTLGEREWPASGFLDALRLLRGARPKLVNGPELFIAMTQLLTVIFRIDAVENENNSRYVAEEKNSTICVNITSYLITVPYLHRYGSRLKLIRLSDIYIMKAQRLGKITISVGVLFVFNLPYPSAYNNNNS